MQGSDEIPCESEPHFLLLRRLIHTLLTMIELGDGVRLEPVSYDDLEALVGIRIDAMRESLERVGRFDPDRARARLVNNFEPLVTFAILRGSERVGFYTLRETADQFFLDHLYVVPSQQGLGIGSRVLRHLQKMSTKVIALNALRESSSNRFYQKHGFIKVDEDEFDIYYRWSQSPQKQTQP